MLAQDRQGGVLPGRVVLCHIDGTVRRLLGRLFATFLRKQKKKKMRKGSLGNTEFSHVLTKRGASPFPWQGPGSS